MGRFFLSLLTIIACDGISASLPATAADYPVCLFGGTSEQMQCGFVSIVQCQATASGGLGYCGPNPTLGFALPYTAERLPRSR